MGNGAFDGETVSNAGLVKQPAAQVVVPPHKTAVYSEAGDTQRDEHIRAIAAHGRIAWQRQHDYGLRNQVALAIQRYKRTTDRLGGVRESATGAPYPQESACPPRQAWQRCWHRFP